MLAGYTLVYGNNLKKSDGTPLNGRIEFLPVYSPGRATSYRSGATPPTPAAYAPGSYNLGDCVTLLAFGGPSVEVFVSTAANNTTVPGASGSSWLQVPAGVLAPGATTAQPVFATVTAGAFAVVLPDTTQTYPVNIGFDVSVYLGVGGRPVLCYQGVQPTGATLCLDTYAPVTPAVAFQVGPQGPPGVTGPVGPAGSVAALTDTVTGSVYQLTFVNGSLEYIKL